MKKALQIDLNHIYGTACQQNQITINPSVKMANGTVSYYENQANESILQEFDGLLGFINLLDLKTTGKSTIPLHVTGADIHIIHLLESQSPIQIKDLQTKEVYAVSPSRGRYLYLTAGDYELHIAKGRSSIFNFYFRCKIFRDDNERAFSFLHPLISAHRSSSTTSCCSIDFKVGPRTRTRIYYLLTKLKKGDLDNEEHILRELKELIKLSNEKIFEEYEAIIESRDEAKLIRAELEKRIHEEGQKFIIEDLSQIFGKSIQYIRRIFKKEYKQSLQQYRNDILIMHVKEQLLLLRNSTQTAYQCGFNNTQHFCTFFQKRTGMTPGKYLSDQKE